jgi:hypothetical protein
LINARVSVLCLKVWRVRLKSWMMSAYVKVEQVLATLETLADEEALKTIEKSREEVARGEYADCSIDDLERVLK